MYFSISVITGDLIISCGTEINGLSNFIISFITVTVIYCSKKSQCSQYLQLAYIYIGNLQQNVLTKIVNESMYNVGLQLPNSLVSLVMTSLPH